MEVKIKNKKEQKKSKEFSKKLKQIEEEKEEYLAYAQRCKADFLNYKKKEGERFKKIIDHEKEEWIIQILPILDHFEKAKKEASKRKEGNPVLEGFLQIQKYFEEFLRRQGIKEIETEIGAKFSPVFEEVIETTKNKKKGEEGIVLEIIQKGYLIEEKVIRPARVRVSSN